SVRRAAPCPALPLIPSPGGYSATAPAARGESRAAVSRPYSFGAASLPPAPCQTARASSPSPGRRRMAGHRPCDRRCARNRADSTPPADKTLFPGPGRSPPPRCPHRTSAEITLSHRTEASVILAPVHADDTRREIDLLDRAGDERYQHFALS